ncbi:hypothetical protein [Mycobacterium sp. NPDC006124]|uniref:hypothetical protein n=1 Tax=Mycobacterium sp. NPDC006124 TaxID=3156729 RepID=UPI0033AD57D9
MSPLDREWTWQDSEPITSIREMLVTLLEGELRRRDPHGHTPDWELRTRSADELAVLRMLDTVESARKILDDTKTGLIMELRWGKTSWGMIAEVLNQRRQRVHEKYQPLWAPDSGPRIWWARAEYELDAARRVAFERLQAAHDDGGDADELERLEQFLEWAKALDRTPKTLKRRYR